MTKHEPGGMPFNKWLAAIGCSRTTGWRWEQKGWIQPVVVNGRKFVTSREIKRFWRRAQAGEFGRLEIDAVPAIA